MEHPANDSERERRRYLRLPLNVAVNCHLIRGGQVVNVFTGRSRDLSAGGLAVRSSQAVAEGETLVVSFKLAADPAGETDTQAADFFSQHQANLLAMRARVVWCAERGGRLYELGMEFMSSEGYARRPLIDFLLDYNLE